MFITFQYVSDTQLDKSGQTGWIKEEQNLEGYDNTGNF